MPQGYTRIFYFLAPSAVALSAIVSDFLSEHCRVILSNPSLVFIHCRCYEGRSRETIDETLYPVSGKKVAQLRGLTRSDN